MIPRILAISLIVSCFLAALARPTLAGVGAERREFSTPGGHFVYRATNLTSRTSVFSKDGIMGILSEIGTDSVARPIWRSRIPGNGIPYLALIESRGRYVVIFSRDDAFTQGPQERVAVHDDKGAITGYWSPGEILVAGENSSHATDSPTASWLEGAYLDEPRERIVLRTREGYRCIHIPSGEVEDYGAVEIFESSDKRTLENRLALLVDELEAMTSRFSGLPPSPDEVYSRILKIRDVAAAVKGVSLSDLDPQELERLDSEAMKLDGGADEPGGALRGYVGGSDSAR